MIVCVPVAGLYLDRACRTLYSERLFGERVEALGAPDGDGVFCVRADDKRCFAHFCEFARARPTGWEREAVWGAQILSLPDLKSEKIALVPRFSRLSVTGRAGLFAKIFLPQQEGGNGEAYCLKNALRDLPAPFDAESAVDTALDLLGVPYRWGGRSAWGIDCSGLISLCYRTSEIWHDTRILHTLPRVCESKARRGDLILFPDHVGLWLGKGCFVHAFAAHGCVTISSLDPEHPLYDPVHTKSGYHFCRLRA